MAMVSWMVHLICALIPNLDSQLIQPGVSMKMHSTKTSMAMDTQAIIRLTSTRILGCESTKLVMLSHLMERSGLTKMVMGLEIIHSEIMPISVQQRTVPPISIRSKLAVKMMVTVGQITGVETSSLAILHSGMILMAMGMVTIGAILRGMLREIRTGQACLSKMQPRRTSVLNLLQPMLMMKGVRRAKEIPIRMVSTICLTIVLKSPKALMDMMMVVRFQSQRPMMKER